MQDLAPTSALVLQQSQSQLKTTYLPEKEVCVRAVPLLLLSSLQQNHRLWYHSIFGFQPYAQALTVLGKKGSRHPQGVITQPEDRSERTGR